MVRRTAQVFGYEKVCGQQAAPLGSALIRCGNQVFARFCKTSVKSWKNPVTFRPALVLYIIEAHRCFLLEKAELSRFGLFY